MKETCCEQENLNCTLIVIRNFSYVLVWNMFFYRNLCPLFVLVCVYVEKLNVKALLYFIYHVHDLFVWKERVAIGFDKFSFDKLTMSTKVYSIFFVFVVFLRLLQMHHVISMVGLLTDEKKKVVAKEVQPAIVD